MQALAKTKKIERSIQPLEFEVKAENAQIDQIIVIISGIHHPANEIVIAAIIMFRFFCVV